LSGESRTLRSDLGSYYWLFLLKLPLFPFSWI